MKRVFTLVLMLFTLTLSAQSDGEVTSWTGIQTNIANLHLVHEQGIADKVAFRLEASAMQQFRYTNFNGIQQVFYGIRPRVSAGARFYYNLDKRANRGKTISANSGNFIGLLSSFEPGRFLYRSDNSMNTDRFVNTVLQWGIRRKLSRHLDFEFTAGWVARLDSFRGLRGIDLSLPHLGWRIGYRF